MPPIRPSSSTTPTDDALVALARAGNAAGLGGLYDRYADRLLRVAWRLTGSVADAEDVVHDVFVSLPMALTRYEHRGTVHAWLAQVTARAALMRVRSGRRRREADLSDATTAVSSGRTDLAAEYADLERAVAALPDALREVFVLREIEGFTHDEIADLLEISAGASRVRLSRAMVALRSALSPSVPPESPVPSCAAGAPTPR